MLEKNHSRLMLLVLHVYGSQHTGPPLLHATCNLPCLRISELIKQHIFIRYFPGSIPLMSRSGL